MVAARTEAHPPASRRPLFETGDEALRRKYEAAVAGLYANCRPVYGSERPVLIEGGAYPGIWLESGPLESTVFALYEPDIAVSSHDIFFVLQRADGYIPCTVYADRTLSGQIQTVVPLAATAWETAELVRDRGFLERAYRACSRWDDWLSAYRDTRGTGLCEAFCEWDTGHDNSPRFAGLPRHCPEQDARVCPPGFKLPYLAPDLSASLYGGRRALARMAAALGLPDDAVRWERLAERTRAALTARCFDPSTEAFYDVDREGRFVRVLGDALTRVLGERVVDRKLFERIFERHLMNPDAFWTPYPFPSVAVSDPQFDRGLPDNSWGGASQALTALRAPRWMESYGKPAELTALMQRWVSAVIADDGFRQQMNPWTGVFSTTDDYSPTMCVLVDFVARLYGVRAGPDRLEWNCRAPGAGAAASVYGLQTDGGWAELATDGGRSILTLEGRRLMEVRGECRIVTDTAGRWQMAVGTAATAQTVSLSLPDGSERLLRLEPNRDISGETGG